VLQNAQKDTREKKMIRRLPRENSGHSYWYMTERGGCFVKMIKRSAALVLVLIFALALVPITAYANGDAVQAHNTAIYSNADTGEAALTFYLLPTVSVQSDNAIIIARSKAITASISGKYEQARAIHDWVSENIWYDRDAVKKGTYASDTALDLVNGGIAVCAGYANLTVALLQAVGIPAKYVSGYALGAGYPDSWDNVPENVASNHAWVEAYVDNRWIIMDTTWDSANIYEDGRKTASGKAMRNYFDISIADLSADHKIIEYLPVYTDGAPPPPTAEKPSSWAEEQVSEAIAAGLVPQNLRENYAEPVPRGDVAQMFINLIEKSSGQSIDAFLAAKGVKIDDSAFTDTADKAVLAASALGIINGVGDGRFAPSGTFTRAQIAAIINRAACVLGVDTSGYTHEFTDVAGHWADAELGWPVHAGIINGVGDNRFAPDGQLTTEQAIAITYRALRSLKEFNENPAELEDTPAPGGSNSSGRSGKFLATIGAPDPNASLIYTAQDLYDICNNSSGSYVLMNDIDLSSFNGGEWVPIGGCFEGVFDGQGHIVRNLRITEGAYGFAGLFRYTNNAEIKNVGLEGTYISGDYYYTGGIAGDSYDTNISNCYNTGNISIDSDNSSVRVGGISGYSNGANISDCYNTGDISASASAPDAGYAFAFVGGIMGFGEADIASISNCYNTGDISAVAFGNAYAGGISGYNSADMTNEINNCDNSGGIFASSQDCAYVGGIAGGIWAVSSDSDISNCCNTGSISAADAFARVGGIAGVSKINISNCYNIGDISTADAASTLAGGVAGQFASGYNISNCYNASDISAAASDDGAYAGGIVGYGGSIGGDSSNMSNCYNSYNIGNISASDPDYAEASAIAGGIAGYSEINISNCYNTGNISAAAAASASAYAAAHAGGIAGASFSTISNCYNKGDIFSSAGYGVYAGGIAGESCSGISNCVVISTSIHAESTNATGRTYSHLIAGSTSSSGRQSNNLALSGIVGNALNDAVRLISAAETKSQSAYEALEWDFDTVWAMVPDYDYPQLRE
jgi:transglutaminase-like putative cysteine protease